MAKCKLSKLQWGRSKSTYTQKHNRANSSVAKAMNTREHNVQDNVCARVHPALRIKQASITVQARANNSKLHICASRILRLLFFSDVFFFFFFPFKAELSPVPFSEPLFGVWKAVVCQDMEKLHTTWWQWPTSGQFRRGRLFLKITNDSCVHHLVLSWTSLPPNVVAFPV